MLTNRHYDFRCLQMFAIHKCIAMIGQLLGKFFGVQLAKAGVTNWVASKLLSQNFQTNYFDYCITTFNRNIGIFEF